MNRTENKGFLGATIKMWIAMVIAAMVVMAGMAYFYMSVGFGIAHAILWIVLGVLVFYGHRRKCLMVAFMIFLVLSIRPANSQALYVPENTSVPAGELDQALLGYDIRMLTGEESSQLQKGGVQALPLLGCAVIVVGAATIVAGVVVAKWCQKKFQSKTNLPPEDPTLFTGGIYSVDNEGEDDDSYAGANTYSSCGTCADGGVYSQMVPTFIDVGVIIEDTINGPVLRMTGAKATPVDTNNVWDFGQMRDYMAKQGVRWDGNVGEISYGKNGRPATEDEMPFYFWYGTIVWKSPAPMYPVAIERSRDLKEWQSIAHLAMPAGMPLNITDASYEGMQFFRAKFNID